jgi:5'(3')-deoxyribonucleotidase
MKQKIIWVDLDEVLAELLDYVLDYNNNKIGSYLIKRDEIKDYYIHKIKDLDISSQQAIDWFRKPMLEDIQKCNILPIVWAKEKLLELKWQWYKLVVLTARIEEIFWEYTKIWLNNHFPDIFDDIIFADHFHANHKEKSDLCLEYWIDIMIEDNIDYANWISKVWVKTYLLEKPWNSWQEDYHGDIIKIKSWDEFMK